MLDDPIISVRGLVTRFGKHTVHDGLDLDVQRGEIIGIVGGSGTGKTMTASVIAQDLGLDLYKIDLSSIVSKYIGETEKNLDCIFRAAQSSNAILFFDEADALFGQRTDVQDAHDRYANVEVDALMRRLQAHPRARSPTPAGTPASRQGQPPPPALPSASPPP